MNLNKNTESGLPVSNYPMSLLIFSIILLGLYATIAQILMFREFLVVFYGNELCVGIIFGSWLFGITIGAGAGGKISSKISTRIYHMNIFLCVLFSMSLLLPLQIGLLRTFRNVLDIPPGQFVPVTSLLYSAALIIIPFSITIGLIFPFACAIFKGITPESSTDIGSVYILEGIGALMGGVIFTFVLVSRVSSFEIMAILAIAILMALALLSFCLNRTTFQKYFTFCCIVLLILYLGLLLLKNISSFDNFLVKKRWNSANSNIQLIESSNSKYHNIVVGRQEDQYNIYVNGQYDFSFPDHYGYSQIAHLVMTQHPNPKRVLLIGGGLGGLIKEILKHPVQELDYVELDPQLIRITKKYLQSEDKEALADKRVKTISIDGRYFIKRAKNSKYDLIFSNTPDPSTALLNRFYTFEFFQKIKKCIMNDGVFITRISSALNYMGEDVGNFTGSVYRTLTNTFPHVIISPGQTNYFFCSNEKDITTFDLDILAKRYNERNIRSKYFSEFNFYTLLQPEQVTLVKNQYKETNNPRLNTDTRPITYFFNLVLWDQFTGGKISRLLRQLEHVKLRYFLIPIFILLVLRLIYLRLKTLLVLRTEKYNQHEHFITYNSQIARFNSLIAVLSIGFAGIAVEIIIIFAFQNIYGYIYEKIGLIIGFFMFGLTIGGYFANKLIINYENGKNDYPKTDQPGSQNFQIVWAKALMAIEISIVFFTLLLPFVLKQFSTSWTGSQFIFFFLIIAAGFLTGMGFPIGAKVYLQTRQVNPKNISQRNGYYTAQSVDTTTLASQSPVINQKAAFAAGLIDSADHLGALFGAILTGIILVPLFGQGGACIVISMLNLASAILLIHFILRR